MNEELQTIVEETRDIETNDMTVSDVHEESQIIDEESSANIELTPDQHLPLLHSLEEPAIIKESSMISIPQESTVRFISSINQFIILLIFLAHCCTQTIRTHITSSSLR